MADDYDGGDQEEQQYDEAPADNGGGDEAEQQYEAPADPEAEPEYEAPAEPEPEYEAPAEPEPEPEPQYEAPAEPEQKQQYNANANVDVPGTIKEAWEDLCHDNNTFNWFSTRLVDPKKLKTPDLKMDKAGKGGLDELKDYLSGESASIIFFLLRVNTYDDENSVRCKFIYGRFMGTGVGFMQKAKVGPNSGAIADNFPVKHMTKDCDENFEGFSPEKLSKEFLRIGGAHKPSKYEYGPNATYTAPGRSKMPTN